MPKYIFAYHGGSMPDTPEAQEAAMAAWGAWMETHKDALADPGNPVGLSKTVLTDGSIEDNGGSNPLSGFSFVDVADMETAIKVAQDCPILNDGGTVEIAPIMEM